MAITEMPRIQEVISRLEKQRGIYKDHDTSASIKAEADLAQLELLEGFPITLSQFIVDVWGLLEAFVRGLVALSLEKLDGMHFDAVTKLRVRIGEYEQQKGSARFHYIVKLLEREEASSVKNGADRFESLLACVGLQGSLPKNLRQALYELSQLRNCIVHNARRADMQLIENCPWLDLTEGQLISPGYERAMRLCKAAKDYSILVVARATTKCGDPMQKTVESVASEWQA
jgi:hypothetical protein